MTLTSLSFFALVLAALILYYVIPLKFRWIVLLVASFVFYGIVCLKYMPFIVFTIITTFLGALWLEKYTADRKAYTKAHKAEWDDETKKKFKHQTLIRKRLIICLVLVLNFGILAFLKYYNWLGAFFGDVFHFSFCELSLFLPLGISFYTFQSMGYLLDVYWEKVKPQKNIAKFALFVSFFPQIIQGPISIYSELADELYVGHKIDYHNLKYGFQLILWGLFMKMVIADRLIIPLNTILSDKLDQGGFWNLLAIVIYALQLYTDFAGGINIARGVAEMFGIHLTENFKRPFFAKSVADFWRRWHISLARWLKTYLFYPIAVSKGFLRMGKGISRKIKGELGTHLGRVLPGCIATLITFFIIGMWHGANWTYAGYGLWNGIIIFISMLLEPVFNWMKEKWKIRVNTFSYRLFQIVRTLLLVVTSFAFDIGGSLAGSLQMIGRAISDPLPGANVNYGEALLYLGLDIKDIIIVVVSLIILFLVSLYQERSQKSVRETLDKQQIWFQWVVTLALLIIIVLMGMYGPGIAANEFVYMNF